MTDSVRDYGAIEFGAGRRLELFACTFGQIDTRDHCQASSKKLVSLKVGNIKCWKDNFGRRSMPTVDVQILEEVFTLEEKQKLIKGIARVFGEVGGEWMRDNTSIRIHEVKSGHWGGADSCWTTEMASSKKSAPV